MNYIGNEVCDRRNFLSRLHEVIYEEIHELIMSIYVSEHKQNTELQFLKLEAILVNLCIKRLIAFVNLKCL